MRIPEIPRWKFVGGPVDWAPSESFCMLYVCWHHFIISSYHSFAIIKNQSTDNERIGRENPHERDKERERVSKFLAEYVAKKQQ